MFAWFPPTWFVDSLSSNGKNNALTIRIRRGPHQAAVYAQERFEFGYKWRRLQVFADKLAMEILSHEVEVQAAALIYGVDAEEYRRREAEMMQSYAWLRGLSLSEIEQRMGAVSPKARAWVLKRQGLLERARGA